MKLRHLHPRVAPHEALLSLLSDDDEGVIDDKSGDKDDGNDRHKMIIMTTMITMTEITEIMLKTDGNTHGIQSPRTGRIQ